MAASGCVLTGLVFLALAFISSAVSFVAPYWYKDGTKTNVGLWASCTDDSCTWFFEDDFKWEKEQKDWHKACQGLFAFGIITLLVAFLVACINLCSGCCREAYTIVQSIGGLLIFAFLQIGISLALFGGKAHEERQLGLNDDSQRYFYWGYWLGVGGCVLILVSACFYTCDSCRARSHEGYTRGEVV